MQQRKASSAKHRALQHFQSVNLVLDRAGTPLELDPSMYRLVVTTQAGGEALEWLERASRRLLQPAIKRHHITSTNQRCKGFGQADGRVQIRMQVTQRLDTLDRRLVSLFWSLHQQPHCVPWGEWPFFAHTDLAVLDRAILRWDAECLAQPRDETENRDPLASVAAFNNLFPQSRPIATAGVPALDQVGDERIQYALLPQHARLPLGEAGRAQIDLNRVAIQAQLTANRLDGPALGVQLARPGSRPSYCATGNRQAPGRFVQAYKASGGVAHPLPP